MQCAVEIGCLVNAVTPCIGHTFAQCTTLVLLLDVTFVQSISCVSISEYAFLELHNLQHLDNASLAEPVLTSACVHFF